MISEIATNLEHLSEEQLQNMSKFTKISEDACIPEICETLIKAVQKRML